MAKSLPENKPKRGKKTKDEVQLEFEELVHETSKAKSSTNAKVESLARMQEKELLNAFKDVSSEEVVRKFAELNIEISSVLSTLSEKIVCEIQHLDKLRQAAELEKKEIEQLHQIDLAQTTLDTLIQDYQTQKELLEREISDQLEEWEQEKEQHSLELQEYEDELTKGRNREAEDYNYKKNLERKKAQDKYEEEVRLRDKQTKEQEDALRKSWQQREEALKSQEEELLNLRKAVQEFPNRLKQGIDQAVSETIQRTEQKQEQEIAFLKRDSVAEQRISELKIKTLEETLMRQSAQVSALQAQLEEANKQVQDIAVKAIEGASGARALSHINQIAIEQAKGRPNPA